MPKPSDHLAALPHAPSDLERDDVGDDERQSKANERPSIGDPRSRDAEHGKDGGGEPDHESGDLLARARGANDRGDDEDPAARRDQIEECDHEEREKDLRRKREAEASNSEED